MSMVKAYTESYEILHNCSKSLNSSQGNLFILLTNIISGKQELAAHRLILCASSEVFQIMLMSNNWTESSERKIVLKESPACEAVFEVFLKYLYTGKISVDYANVIPILQLADKYNVKDLLRVGLDFMSRNVPLSGRKNQVVSWYQFTTNCGYNKVADMCLNFIKWNFDLVRNSINLCQYSIF